MSVLDLDVRRPDPFFNQPEHSAGILLQHGPTATGFAHPVPPCSSVLRWVAGAPCSMLGPRLRAAMPPVQAHVAAHGSLLQCKIKCEITRRRLHPGARMLPNFETLFGIPHHYRLVLIRSRSRGGRVRGDYWSHHEVDP